MTELTPDHFLATYHLPALPTLQVNANTSSAYGNGGDKFAQPCPAAAFDLRLGANVQQTTAH